MRSTENIRWRNKDIVSLGEEEQLTQEEMNERVEALVEMEALEINKGCGDNLSRNVLKL